MHSIHSTACYMYTATHPSLVLTCYIVSLTVWYRPRVTTGKMKGRQVLEETEAVQGTR